MTYTGDNSTHDEIVKTFIWRIERERERLFVVFFDVIVDTLHRGLVDV